MKTRSTDPEQKTGLPPPPAPTASDANPWQMSSPAGDARHEPRHPRASGSPPRPRWPDAGAVRRAGRLPWIPLLILFAIAATGVQLAIRALWAGEIEAAIGALIMVGMVAFIALRRLTRKH